MDQVHRTARENEGTTVYLKFIHDHPDLHNNPFFPKVKGIRKLSNGVSTIDIERLVPYQQKGLGDNAELLSSLYRQYFGSADSIKQFDAESDEDYASRMRFRFEDAVERAVEYGGRNTTDPYLKQAAHIIQHIRATNDLLIDIHAGNIMWRLTSVGPQLVITDPLWAGWGALAASYSG
jgi:hypothetical protein